MTQDGQSYSISPDLAFPSTSFTPINRLRPSPSIAIDAEASNQSRLALAEDEMPCNRESNQAADNQVRCLKRDRSITGDDGGSRVKRQLVWPATSAFNPFQTLKSTRCDSHSSNNWTSKSSSGKYHSTQTTKTTMDQLVSPPTQISDQTPSSSLLDLENDTSHNNIQAPIRGKDANSAIPPMPSKTYNAGDIDVSTCNGIPKQQHATSETNLVDIPHGSQMNETGSLYDDEYPLDDLLEEDMTLLLDTTQDCIRERHIPPSSVTHIWDHDSRSAVEFDPNLQYSSPQASSKNCATANSKRISPTGAREPIGTEVYLLDNEVDWHAVHAMASAVFKDPAPASPPQQQKHTEATLSTTSNQYDGSSYTIDDSMALRPFPPRVLPGDMSNMSKLTGNKVLRTCFRIGEMLSQSVQCHKLKQEVVFELFARVTYSSRERVSKKQHFQFVDLQKDQQPYPTGILTGWKTGSHLDQQSLAFADTKAYPKLCWCLCQPKKNPKVATGWAYTILSIKETDWQQIYLARTVLQGGDGGSSKGALMARL